MTATTRALVQQFWDAANARDWDRFGALLHPDLVYAVPQTRERANGRDGLVDVFRTWPGDWDAQVQTLIADERGAVTTIAFVIGSDCMTGISFFEFDGGLISRVTDWWPAPYEPPPRVSAWLQRD
jgi:ketosteroid isomerase-like protein